MNSPRIYTYKVTFEEIPDWYWGVHKEKKYNDGYLGSPVTHAWKWEFYTPHIQICEIFPYTDEGWRDAKNVEHRIILPDLNNPLCLNEHCGEAPSLEILRRTGKRMFEESKGIHSPESRQKQKEMMTGREVSGVARNRLSEAMVGNKHCLGRVHTEETKQKIALAATGNQNRLGMAHSEETKQKMSNSQKGRVFTEEHKQNLSNSKQGERNNRHGTRHSEETKRLMSELAKRRWGA
jgi:hypothetical protein